MNNIGLEVVFWTVLALYILTKIGVFKKGKWTYRIGNIILEKKEKSHLIASRFSRQMLFSFL